MAESIGSTPAGNELVVLGRTDYDMTLDALDVRGGVIDPGLSSSRHELTLGGDYLDDVVECTADLEAFND